MKDRVCEYYFSTSNFMKANLWKWILCLVLTEVGIFLLPLKNQDKKRLSFGSDDI